MSTIDVDRFRKRRLELYGTSNAIEINKDQLSRKIKIGAKIVGEYENIQFVAQAAAEKDEQLKRFKNKKTEEKNEPTNETVDDKEGNGEEISKVLNSLNKEKESDNQALVTYSGETKQKNIAKKNAKLLRLGASDLVKENSTAVSTRRKTVDVVEPKWHAPWKISRVIAGHVGWVRCVSVDPSNEFFFTGSNDRTIKCWDLASGKLKLTLTGHSHSVRGLASSPNHPYLFSVGDDKTVKCWDLETNQVIRHYHGHLQGIHCVAVHPKLDILMTGSRDASIRVWDMRTRQEVHLLTGHENSVEALLVQSVDPQVISGSMDKTVKLWDLAAGKIMTTLTNHSKGVRALAKNPVEHSFVSAAADCLKKWECRNGDLMLNLFGHEGIVNAVAVNRRDVLFSGGDDGSVRFWDWPSGHCFMSDQTIPQPGSLDSEACILAASFDQTGSRLITCEADKSVKIWKEDSEATPHSHPLNWDRATATYLQTNERY